MLKTGLLCLTIVALSGGLPARAQVMVDVAKVSCGQFATHKVTNPKSIAIWLNGYYHGKRGDTVIDTQQLDEDTDKVLTYCTKNPDAPVMQAVETVIGPPK
jgi:acid stress chaperone HdeB